MHGTGAVDDTVAEHRRNFVLDYRSHKAAARPQSRGRNIELCVGQAHESPEEVARGARSTAAGLSGAVTRLPYARPPAGSSISILDLPHPAQPKPGFSCADLNELSRAIRDHHRAGHNVYRRDAEGSGTRRCVERGPLRC